MNITHLAGGTLEFADLPENTVALDGAVQGPAIDAEGRRFSFDHHGNCVRLVTLATCEQVAVALRLGYRPDRETKCFINDVDADTSLAVWLLENPERALEDTVWEVVRAIGLTDAHGPAMPIHPLHRALSRAPGDPAKLTAKALSDDLVAISLYFSGRPLSGDDVHTKRPGNAWVWDGRTWASASTPDGFGPLYAAGALVVALAAPREDGTTTWTIGKASDLVAFPLGPAADGAVTSEGDYIVSNLLGFLAAYEHIAKDQTIVGNWGGGTSIGGSPRNRDGSSSKIDFGQMGIFLSEFTH